MAPTIKVGDTIPEGEFGYIPYSPALDDLVSLLTTPPLSLEMAD